MKKNESLENYELAARVLAKEADKEEVDSQRKWASDNLANMESWRELENCWHLASEAAIIESVDVDKGWKMVKNRIPVNVSQPSRSRLHYYVAAIAASAIIVLATVPVLKLLERKPVPGIVSFYPGQFHELSDGSMILLNNGSKAAAIQPFGPNERKIELSGEAFFEISEDINSPFIIRTGDIEVRVTGTSLNIRNCVETHFTYVDVSHGTVEIWHQQTTLPPLRLEAGSGATYNQTTRELKKVNSNPNAFAWKTRNLIFTNDYLSDVFQLIERVYDVKIVVNDPSIMNQRFGGNFDNQQISHVLNTICVTFNLTYITSNGVITIDWAN